MTKRTTRPAPSCRSPTRLPRVPDRRGVFQVRTAPSYVASVFGWSRQTLYARLKLARSGAGRPRPSIEGETS